MRKSILALSLLSACVIAPSAAFAQQGGRIDIGKIQSEIKGFDHLFFTTAIGSFKIISGGKTIKGRLHMSFAGSVLVSGLLDGGKVTTEGAVEKQYEDKAHKKLAYHGRGTITVEGEFRAIQWFGSDLNGDLKADAAIMGLYGEFDKDLHTGYYWWEPTPEQKKEWGNWGMRLTLPLAEAERPAIKK